EAEVEPFLDSETNLAAVNGAKSCVIAGPFEAADSVEQKMADAGIEAKRLHTSHAFHSSMMDPIVDEFEGLVRDAELSAPKIPILSTVTNQWLTDDEARDPKYWAGHLRQPVRFYQSVSQLWERSDHLLLEVGPGRTLATLAGQNPDRKNAQPSLASLPHPNKPTCSQTFMRTTLGQLWCYGLALDWDLVEARSEKMPRLPLPTYAFQRKRFWIEPEISTPASPFGQMPMLPLPNPVLSQPQTAICHSTMDTSDTTSNGIEEALKDALSDLSGIEPSEMDGQASFLELGFDSLLLTQVGKELQDTFGVKVTLRQLMDEFACIDDLKAHLESNCDSSKFVSSGSAETGVPSPQAAMPQMGAMPQMPAMPQMGQAPMMQQMAVMQYDANGQPVMVPMMMYPMPMQMPQAPPIQQGVPSMPVTQPPAQAVAGPEMQPEADEPAKPEPVSGPATVIDRVKDEEGLSDGQQRHLDRLIDRYTSKTPTSKQLTQRYRASHADPRTASGFNRIWKEMVYQIVTNRSKGSRLLDVDGNEYIDILNGFGPGFLGHSADFLVEAVEKQLHQGYEVGPQSLLAMEAAELFCEVTGNERTSFVCTGSEAVAAAMRLARTVTKRDKVVIFARDYHGNFDEVLVRGVNGRGKLKTLPSAPGIPKASTENVVVLPYGTDESLEIIRGMADQLAAVVVEPVQSRRPEFRPAEFIREVREITRKKGALFVFDEVVTGFRFGPRGAQEFYGVDADLCTYGKVIGGGMPLGVVSGKAEFMDTFDGGMWQYGDDSFPEQPVTFFAGTFVRHPLAMASVKAMLEFFKKQPEHFWDTVNAKG
ncbi:MAG: aminotransferase class III-fold pyridoxal phosphate-dependent enzyme, partial [Verrucomicrobiota bacterium]